MTFDQPALDEAEDVLQVFYGGRGQVGGQLVVTNRRILFGPVDTALVRSIGFEALSALGAPGIDIVKAALDAYEPLKQKQIWLRHIRSVDALGTASLFSPPKIVIVTATNERIEYGIVATTTTPNGDTRNNGVRDLAVQVLRTAVGLARGDRTTPAVPGSIAGTSGAAIARDVLSGAAVGTGAGATDDKIAAARASAVASGSPVPLWDEAPFTVFVLPDRSLHWAFVDSAPRPANFALPINLVGAWWLAGDPTDVITLSAEGAVGGSVQLFGALPPHDIGGQWWWEADTQTVGVEVRVVIPELDDYPWVFEALTRVRLTHIGSTVLVGIANDPERGPREVVFHRAAGA